MTIPADFIPIEDPKEAAFLINEGAKLRSQVTAWTVDKESGEQVKLFETRLNYLSETEKMLYVQIPKNLVLPTELREKPSGDFKIMLDRMVSSDVLFNIALPRASLFFKSSFLGYGGLGFKFKPPEKIFKIQRRKDARFPLPPQLSLKVAFIDPLIPENTLQMKVLDISAGGMAFLIAPHEEAFFHSGLILRALVFTISGRKYTCDAEVRHLKEFPSTSMHKGFRVGIQFKGLKESDSQHLASYVFEEGRKYYLKFL